MNEPQNQEEGTVSNQPTASLYIYGSCQSDQYYHPTGLSESKRPICLSDIEKFTLDDEDADPPTSPKIIPNPLFRQQIIKIACGALHTVVVTLEGQAFTFGCNDEGALGRQGPQKIPTKVNLDAVIDLVSAGDNHTVFGSSQGGSIFFTGSYKYMRGESISERTTTPIRYEIKQLDHRLKDQPIKKVVSGSNHSAVLVGGKIFIRGEPEAHTVGRRINQRHKVSNSLSFDALNLKYVQDLWCGGYHNIAKCKKSARSNEFVYWVWGLNKHGQLGMRSYDDVPYPQQLQAIRGKNIVEVAAGTNFTVLLTEEGQLWGCGQNDDGQLALGQDYVYVDTEEEQERVQRQQEQQQERLRQGEEEKKQAEEKKEEDKGQKIEQAGQAVNPEESKQGQKAIITISNTISLPAAQDKQNSNQENGNVINKTLVLEIEKNPETQKLIEQNASEPKPMQIQQNNNQVQEKKEEELKNSEENLVKQQNKVAQKKQNEQPKGLIQQSEKKVPQQKQEVIPLPPPPQSQTEKKMEVQEPVQPSNRLVEENIYIKSLKRINIQENVDRIRAGAQFCFAWNDKNLYSWGFGSNFVLLNGQEDDELTPFRVKPKIINDQVILDLVAGAQHVVYLSYPSSSQKPTPKLSEAALAKSQPVSHQKLSRKKKV